MHYVYFAPSFSIKMNSLNNNKKCSQLISPTFISTELKKKYFKIDRDLDSKKLEESLDIFQRKQLRRMLNTKLTDKIRNEKTYKRSHPIPITTEIKKRQINWLGHMLRLPEGAPAKLAFKKHLKKAKGNRGRPKQTWINKSVKI